MILSPKINFVSQVFNRYNFLSMKILTKKHLKVSIWMKPTEERMNKHFLKIFKKIWMNWSIMLIEHHFRQNWKLKALLKKLCLQLATKKMILMVKSKILFHSLRIKRGSWIIKLIAMIISPIIKQIKIYREILKHINNQSLTFKISNQKLIKSKIRKTCICKT
jgi:hypothetical protein